MDESTLVDLLSIIILLMLGFLLMMLYVATENTVMDFFRDIVRTVFYSFLTALLIQKFIKKLFY